MMSKSFKKRTANQDASAIDGEGHVYDLRPKGLRNSIAYTGSGDIDELLEDMDTSDSEHSDLDESDIEWLHSEDFENELKQQKKHAKKRNSKTDDNLGKTSPSEGDDGLIQKPSSGVCCSCSKFSLCKTLKCECRAARGVCSISCGCHPKKCSNRETPSVEEFGLQSSGAEETESELASHGAMLLQAALADKPVETNEVDGTKRKPLSDIGNTAAKPNVPKPSATRKKWRKSVIKLVPVSSDQSNPNGPEKQEAGPAEPAQPSIPLRLPRAMRTAMSNPPFRDRNADQLTDSSVVNKEPDHAGPRSPRHQARSTTSEKENHAV